MAFDFIVFGLENKINVKVSEILTFLPLKNNSVTMGLNLPLASISAIVSSNNINTSFFNWDSLHTRLNSHYKAWSYKKKKHKKIKAYRKFV